MQVKHRADSLISANHYDPKSVRDIAEDVTKRWQQLVTCAEERHKLVTASINFYKTAEQVSTIKIFEKNKINLLLIVAKKNFFS